jgi:IclR family acetate operon transcriptional repressor
MRNRELQKRPMYVLSSVDNALRLLQLIRDEGSIRVKEAAAELEVSQSTAHRLLSMLVYRGFAAQDESKAYLPGPALGAAPAGVSWTRTLRLASTPHMLELAELCGETVNLMIRVGAVVRFLLTVEGGNALDADRQGAVLPACDASGGKALLATMDDAALERMYRGGASRPLDRMDDARYERFLRQIELARLNGYAINSQETEPDVTAVGVVVRSPSRTPIAALTASSPTPRFRQLIEGGLVRELISTRDRIERELAAMSRI